MALTPAQIAERGEQIYQEKYRSVYEDSHAGQIAAIEIQTEQIFLAKSVEGALLAGRKAHPTGVFHLLRIGAAGVFRTAYSEVQHGDWVFGR